MVEQRFIFRFINIENKVIKQYKALKPKNKYSLRQAETIVKQLQKELLIPVMLTLHCDDMENDMTYLFDAIKVPNKDEEVEEMLLLRHIEQQILSSDMPNVQQLMMAIHHQYSKEKEIDEAFNLNKPLKNKKFLRGLIR